MSLLSGIARKGAGRGVECCAERRPLGNGFCFGGDPVDPQLDACVDPADPQLEDPDDSGLDDRESLLAALAGMYIVSFWATSMKDGV